MPHARHALLWATLCVAAPEVATAQVTTDLPAVLPAAVVDLRTQEGAALVQARWRYSDVKVTEIDHHAPGPDLKPSGPPTRTNDITPHAEAADFDDSAWPTIEPASLENRRSNGKLAFNWYRTTITLPARVAGFDVAGSTVVFELVIDDYAEIWVDGKLPLVLGQTGGQLIKGFNAPNRVVLTRDARPGQRIQLAIFGVNGPISRPPVNFIWIRSATLDFYRRDQVGGAQATTGEVVRLDPGLDRVIAPGTKLEKLAGGFQFIEGPVWHPDGYLLFSDPNANTIYRWSPEGAVSVFRTKSGYSGFDIGEYHQPGSNGLTLDRNGLLTINEHGNRRVTRLERPGNITVLADHYQGKRLNSPNDLVYRSDGTLYFTDPPFGLPKAFDDPRKELPFSGVYMVKDGQVTLLTKELSGPNGIAFSPDEKYLYVDNWDLSRKVLMRYEVQSDGTIANGKVFYDFTSDPEPVALDGIKVDEEGNVYVSAPGGVWIISAAGKPLGRIVPPEHDANFAFGDADGKTLYLTASTGLYRIRVGIPGIRPQANVQAASLHPKPSRDPMITRLDPRFDALVPSGARLEKIVDDHGWTEGPVWVREGGFLLFSDVVKNAIYRWKDGEGESVFLPRSGYGGGQPFAGKEPGSNGLAIDREGRLVFCQHGERRIVRREVDGSLTVLADRYRGKRINSPNDLAYRTNGDLYFTDPPFGLPASYADPGKELGFQGVYRLTPGGTLTLLTDDLSGPNGIAFSPDERTLYVSNADARRLVWMAYQVKDDGTLGAGRVFFDGTRMFAGRPGTADGLKVDARGNIFAVGPGGVYVFAPDATLLGWFDFGGNVGNVAWGEDGSTLFVAANAAVYRVRLSTVGNGFESSGKLFTAETQR